MSSNILSLEEIESIEPMKIDNPSKEESLYTNGQTEALKKLMTEETISPEREQDIHEFAMEMYATPPSESTNP